ncbi:hypothetical protein [Bradyrhizobium cenepequi]|uniref:hypothetical protein n=1 Tax=Bradyrhizobium cenepequi TaxID=2821403 RepID=UPI001CE3953A|nr:hypothetical protein [Bradyrhizobium cenepequi]MCA6108977.1 hypothetical protein [Bradyrhizobium cenepequi]
MHLVILSNVRARSRSDAGPPGMRRSVRVPSGYRTEPMRLRDPAIGQLGFFRRGAVASNAILIARAGGIAGIPIRLPDFVTRTWDQKLLSHFGEAGAAIFAVKQV